MFIIDEIINFGVRLIIRFYQFFISPMITFLFGPVCRYTPSCSEYSYLAFKNYPFLIALYLSIKRVLSCHPFNEGGEDPLPQKFVLHIGNREYNFHAKHFYENQTTQN
ncbi:MAG: membrane protein insertion efficiency factor YidD [Leptospiraceae bacterium]|nr:membrane protein insertion efficiency factor YidD [Leptospiraceae bacterium]MDW7975334.1 membrane protein insertion efficiency factor YidD [Leptospiraceae bacterium]